MTRKLKVIHVITKLELGGAQKFVLMALERLPRSHYEVGLVSGPQGLLRDQAESIPELETFWIASLVRELRPWKDIAAFVGLFRLFRRQKPDIVHTHSSKAGILGRWAAWLAGVPIIFHTIHGFAFHDYQGRLERALYVGLERLTARITTQFMMVSRANAVRAEALGIVSPGGWILCRPGIPLSEFSNDGERLAPTDWGVPGDGTLVGMVACLKPQKAPLDFIEVARHVISRNRSVHFVLAGDGDLRAQVQARIDALDLGDHVTLLGWRRDMPETYRKLDIFLLTSLWEGQPCVFAEAMASGLPIVATGADGAREAIEDAVTGFVCPPGDVPALSEAVLRLAADPDLRRRMGELARARVHEFDIDAAVARLDSAYAEKARRSAALGYSGPRAREDRFTDV